MFVTWLVSHVEMWPYVDSAELRLLSQELTAEWILLLDACQPVAGWLLWPAGEYCSRRTPDAFGASPRSSLRRTAGGGSADASSATATHAQAVRLAAIVANSGRAAATTPGKLPAAALSILKLKASKASVL